ncbi:Type III secretion outermembrane contact sensing protein (YopN,Yop4b,LcrE) [Photobacterium marinum]|uniref:Type III secretion outermembrane contact sensing protein (YopN,Yop4b,LcrE) n=1 Tax=Photobacterium marinum TaxID=1056511 RepID=L8JED9_9GAMM|nr:TyeA family type III secretion system gatekeeper subunit [Photobacterium marinum]ELR67216.1 Type III secretion outermembrane contact sensing protein (YopN,Yop4b,LcrE) [Photobacterium marinum]
MAEVSGHMPGNLAAVAGLNSGGAKADSVVSGVAVLDKSSLADSAEELSFALAEKRPKSMAERKSEKDDSARLAWIEKIRQLLEKAPDLEKQQKLVDFVAANLGRSQTAEAFIENLKSFSDDESLQYMAGQLLAEASDSQDSEHYEAALKAFKEKNARNVLAGLNTSEVFAKELPTEQLSEARQSYRDLTDYQSHSRAWRQLVQMAKQYGSVEQAAEIHQRALSADYHALEPSQDRDILAMVMQNLNQLKQLKGIFEQTVDLARQIQGQFFVPVDEQLLMEQVLSFPDSQFVTVRQMAQMMQRLNITAFPAQVVTQQGMKAIAGDLPDGLYPGLEQRNRVMDSLQQCIDQVIDKEEMWLDGQ